MSEKNDLHNIVIEINNLLNEYVKIHDEVFKFSWRKIIPLPFIFKTINFGDLLLKAKIILRALEKNKNYIYKDITTKNDFTDALLEYNLALIDTISIFIETLHQLDLKSRNSGNYNLSKHNKLLQEYEKTVEKYCSTGNKLNELYSRSSK